MTPHAPRVFPYGTKGSSWHMPRLGASATMGLSRRAQWSEEHNGVGGGCLKPAGPWHLIGRCSCSIDQLGASSRLSTQISVFPVLKQGKAERITNGFRLYRLWNADRRRPFVTEVRFCALFVVLTVSIPPFGCLHKHGDWIRHLGQSRIPHAQLRTIFNFSMSKLRCQARCPA